MMAIKVRQIWVDEKGEELPDTDMRLYDMPCHNCGPMPYVGRVDSVFLCLGCIGEQAAEEDAIVPRVHRRTGAGRGDDE